MSTIPASSRASAGLRPAVEGAKAMLPLLLAVAPLGLVVGVKAGEADLPAGAAWATGSLIYGASAQLAAIDLLDRGIGPVMVVLTVVVVNARLALYSAALAPHWGDMPSRRRLLGAYLLVDPAYAVGTEGYRRDLPARDRHSFYLGGGVVLWAGWQLITFVGMVVGDRVPASLQLEFAVPLCMLAIVVDQLDDHPGAAVAAGTAAVVAVAGHDLPLATGLLAAILLGIGAGARRAAAVEET